MEERQGNLMKWLDLLLKLLAIFGIEKKSPQEIEDEAKKEVANTSLDDDIADINSELRDRT
jgi:hypothetical protein